MKRIILLLSLILFITSLYSQQNLDYQVPPKEILELVDAPLAPGILMDRNAENLLMIYTSKYKTIEELSENEMRLGGLRINPVTNIGSRTRFYNNIEIKTLSGNKIRKVKGLPANPRMSGFTWSPDQKNVAFLNATSRGVELWVLDIEEAIAKKLTEPKVNANMWGSLSWFPDNSALLVRILPADRKELIDTEKAVPSGPIVSVSEGEKAQNRTYQDLLKDPNDEFNFEQLTLSELYKVSLDGEESIWLPSAMYTETSFSPDGEYIMVSRIKRPFSYLVPYYRFPTETVIYDKAANKVQLINDVPLTEVIPQGFDATRTGRRSVSWRADKPATVYWAEALDEGDPGVEMEYRDAVYQLEAPFNGNPELILKTKNRYRGIIWGNDEVAVAYDMWWKNRNTKAYLFNPSNPEKEPDIIFDRSTQDRYNDPGNFVTKPNEFNEYVLEIIKNKAFLIGDGFSERGQFPFIDEFDLKSHDTKRLYESSYTDKLENIYNAIDMKKGEVLVRIESKNEYPNYYIRNIRKKIGLIPVTDFENPFKSIQDVHKEVITYKRDDGLELDATLYLPVGYDMKKKEKKPMILWAYPREFKDKSSASQVTSNPNEFTYPHYGSPLFWVTQGYVLLDDAAFPIVGEGEEEPNDSFREQLVANAKAAIDAVDEMGYIDRNRVAVGGHSYGAFMVANLLSHSDLFAAGIARSGAYNRTLTPFGFQSEERTYWDSPETYYTMSPFMHADKMDTPLLLIHGEADNNSGTYPMQSERYFNALKGLGKPARLVILPKESHGYTARESILHMLWEQHEWLEKYVKNKEAVAKTD
jgi:dipeptidyl aminopeptidase/acylaminoacyl peptidase